VDYEVLKSTVKFKGKVLTLRVDEVRMPSGHIAEREVLSHFGAVGMVPLLESGEIVLVEQYRHAISSAILEIPAGKLTPGEDPLSCAGRELIEEIGMEAGKLLKLAEFYTTPGYSNEYFYLYLATDLRKIGGVEPEEEITGVKQIPLEEALNLIFASKIQDGKTIAGLCLAKLYLGRQQK
jgi:ADP-ribose pyrophosphatase